MRTRLDFGLDDIQRQAHLRRLGRDLHDRAAATAPETADAMQRSCRGRRLPPTMASWLPQSFGVGILVDGGGHPARLSSEAN